MAIFGLFGKKDSKPAPAAGKKPSSTSPQQSEPARPVTAPAADLKGKRRDPSVASATAKKIDAIESEMSEEFIAARPAGGNTIPGNYTPPRPPPLSTSAPATQPSFESTLPSIGMSTEFLLGPQGKSTDIIISSESAQVIEEAAILYASQQAPMAEQVLRVAIDADILGDGGRRAWDMLFELYQLSGRQAEFDALCMNFASRFETSPPSWRDMSTEELLPARLTTPRAAAIPSVAFVGKLDGNIVRLLERVQKLGATNRALRLEFGRVSEVDPVGCGLLLRILNRLLASDHELVLVDARELANKIRAILKVGRRDETEAPWLLLLEILRLLNAEAEFEETSMDYCITFEVSPPAFVAPQSKVTTAAAGNEEDEGAPSFSMPALVEGQSEAIIGNVVAFANSHDPALIDCSRLRRIDFNAGGQLLSGLAPVAAAGRVIEFTEVNHMVAALFDVIGLKEIARIASRKS